VPSGYRAGAFFVTLRASEGTKMRLAERDLPDVRLVELPCAVCPSPVSDMGGQQALPLKESCGIRYETFMLSIVLMETNLIPSEVRSRLKLFVQTYRLFSHAKQHLQDAQCVGASLLAEEYSCSECLGRRVDIVSRECLTWTCST